MAVQLISALNDLYPGVVKATAPKFSTVTAVNINPGTALSPIDSGLYKASPQCITIVGSNLPDEAAWLNDGYQLVGVTRNAGGVSQEKVLNNYISVTVPKSITVLCPDTLREDGVDGFLELRSSSGLPKCAIEVTLHATPSSG